MLRVGMWGEGEGRAERADAEAAKELRAGQRRRFHDDMSMVIVDLRGSQ